MLYGIVQGEYGIFGKMEKRSLTFILMNEVFLKMERKYSENRKVLWYAWL